MLHTEHCITSKGEQANLVTSVFYNQYETNTIIAFIWEHLFVTYSCTFSCFEIY